MDSEAAISEWLVEPDMDPHGEVTELVSEGQELSRRCRFITNITYPPCTLITGETCIPSWKRCSSCYFRVALFAITSIFVDYSESTANVNISCPNLAIGYGKFKRAFEDIPEGMIVTSAA